MRFSKLRHKLINLLSDDIIIQFSPIRSGSTLVYNILQEVFPKTTIYKRHKCTQDAMKHKVVITYRHPLDCIASSIQRYGLSPTDEIVEKQIYEFNKYGGKDILRINKKTNVLMLRYEDFVYDFEVILGGIEEFFAIAIQSEKRCYIKQKYAIESIQTNIQKMSHFSEYNKETHWHGRHISKYKGKPFYYKDFFQDYQIAYLCNIYKDFLLKFGYIQSK